jgi:DNA-binding beta-propeller fold protein YncE
VDRREFLAAATGLPVALALGPRASAARLAGRAPLALVTADLESHVAVLDLATTEPVKRIRTAPGPRAVESIRGTRAVVAHTEHGLVTLLDAFRLEIRAELEHFEEPRYVAAHPVWMIAYVTDSAREEVVAIDVEQARVLGRASVPGPARHVSISHDGKTIWTALGTKAARVAVLDASDPRRPRLVRTISPPFLAHDVVFAPDGRTVWVTSGDERRIALYREERRPARILPADAPPQHVAFAREKAFVASGDDGTLRRHRLDGELVREARVPVGSYNVASGGGRVVSPSLDQGTVSVLDRNGRVRAVRKIARAAHDACVVHAS